MPAGARRRRVRASSGRSAGTPPSSPSNNDTPPATNAGRGEEISVLEHAGGRWTNAKKCNARRNSRRNERTFARQRMAAWVCRWRGWRGGGGVRGLPRAAHRGGGEALALPCGPLGPRGVQLGLPQRGEGRRPCGGCWTLAQHLGEEMGWQGVAERGQEHG